MHLLTKYMQKKLLYIYIYISANIDIYEYVRKYINIVND